MKRLIPILICMLGVVTAFCQHKTVEVSQYFPPPGRDKSAVDTSSTKWYSYVLHLMKEPPLFNDKSQNETYRFLWLRTFHHPVAIRLTKQQNEYTIYWKVLDGKAGYDPGKLVIQKQKSIRKEDWESFLIKLKPLNFWKLKKDGKSQFGTDGSKWLLEGKSIKQYQAIDAWSPRGKFYACGDFLIKLTDLVIKKDEEY